MAFRLVLEAISRIKSVHFVVVLRQELSVESDILESEKLPVSPNSLIFQVKEMACPTGRTNLGGALDSWSHRVILLPLLTETVPPKIFADY